VRPETTATGGGAKPGSRVHPVTRIDRRSVARSDPWHEGGVAGSPGGRGAQPVHARSAARPPPSARQPPPGGIGGTGVGAPACHGRCPQTCAA